METVYRIEGVENDVICSAVSSGVVPGASIYMRKDGDPNEWPYAITDGKNYLWPEGYDTWVSRGDGAIAIFNLLQNVFDITVISEYEDDFMPDYGSEMLGTLDRFI